MRSVVHPVFRASPAQIGVLAVSAALAGLFLTVAPAHAQQIISAHSGLSGGRSALPGGGPVTSGVIRGPGGGESARPSGSPFGSAPSPYGTYRSFPSPNWSGSPGFPFPFSYNNNYYRPPVYNQGPGYWNRGGQGVSAPDTNPEVVIHRPGPPPTHTVVTPPPHTLPDYPALLNGGSSRIITVPNGPYVRRHHGGGGYPGYYGGDYIYDDNGFIVTSGGPALLGGYYYGGYTMADTGVNCYPSVYYDYNGLPEFIYNPGVVVLDQPPYPSYYTPYLPFTAPTYQTIYNNNSYYVGSEKQAAALEEGGATAKKALDNAYPEDSYQAAFADIEGAWRDGNIALIRKHIRDDDTKISVFFNHKYAYSIASGDFVEITRDAFEKLSTVSFDFSRIRKSKNGDVTAYGKHVYRVIGGTSGDTDDNTSGTDTSGKPSADTGGEKTIYVSYTLRHGDGQWYIVGTSSSPTDLVTSSSSASDTADATADQPNK